MKNESNKIPFKDFLRQLRPDLRPSLAAKEFHKLHCCILGKFMVERDPTWNSEEEKQAIKPDEIKVERLALENELAYKTNGLTNGQAASFLAEYKVWRPAETSRRRAEAARLKAQKEAADKQTRERAKLEKRAARKQKIEIVGKITAEVLQRAQDKSALDDWRRNLANE